MVFDVAIADTRRSLVVEFDASAGMGERYGQTYAKFVRVGTPNGFLTRNAQDCVGN